MPSTDDLILVRHFRSAIADRHMTISEIESEVGSTIWRKARRGGTWRHQWLKKADVDRWMSQRTFKFSS